MNAHWFDRLHRTLTEDAPRRGLLRSASALLAGIALHSGSQRALGKRRNKKNRKRKKNGKDNGKGNGGGQANACGAAICDQEFAGAEVGECMAKCERCRLEDRFCVIEGDLHDPTKIATCCFEDQQCCQETFACCPQDHTCCGGYPERNRPCCPPDTFCCDSSDEGCCAATQGCCPGHGCVNLEADPHNCGECGRVCPDQMICRDRECICQNGDEQLCGDLCILNGYICCPWNPNPGWAHSGYACLPGFTCCGEQFGYPTCSSPDLDGNCP